MDKKKYRLFQKSLERDYRVTFNGQGEKMHVAASAVLADLRNYCNATKSSFNSDVAEMARMEGRREVFNRIMAFLEIDYRDYYELEQEFDDFI